MYNSTCRFVSFFSLSSTSRVSSRVSLLQHFFGGGGGGSGAAFGGRCGSLLFLRLGVSAGCGRFGGCLPAVLGWFLLLHHGGPHAATGPAGLLWMVASPVFIDAAAADARSTFEVCRGVLGAACRFWQMEFVLTSSSGVSSGLCGGRVIWWCLKSLVECVMYFQ
jgi:hypothetical protein